MTPPLPPELLAHIASFTKTTGLLSLVYASKITSSAAIPFLWRVLPCPLPVLKIFRGFQWLNGRWRLLNHPDRADWERFDVYAPSTIAFLSLVPTEPHDANALVFLKQCRPRRPLFPRLRSFTLSPSSMSGCLSSISPFLCQELCEAHLCFADEDQDYLQELSHHMPTMIRLDLSGAFDPCTLVHISSFHRLQSLIIHFSRNISLEEELALRGLRLPASLISLDVYFPSTFDFPFLSTAVCSSIKHLTLKGPASIVEENLPYISMLVRVVIIFTSISASTEELRRCCQIVASTSNTSLLQLSLETGGNPSLRQSIGPLFSVSTITSFIFLNYTAHNTDISDEDLILIVKAWPNLSSLVLPTYYATSRLTSRGLDILALLPNLETVQLTIHDQDASLSS